MVPVSDHLTLLVLSRCEYYERETARQAFEYVYSKPNCHPCNSFKLNSPFLCERTVRKTVGEVIALQARCFGHFSRVHRVCSHRPNSLWR